MEGWTQHGVQVALLQPVKHGAVDMPSIAEGFSPAVDTDVTAVCVSAALAEPLEHARRRSLRER